MWCLQNSPLENIEKFSLKELLAIDSVRGTRLLVFKFEIYIIGLLIVVLLLSHIAALSVLKDFLLNRSKKYLKRVINDRYCFIKITHMPHSIRNIRIG